VHDDERGAGLRAQLGEPQVGEAARVVDHRRSDREDGLGDGRLPRVDRDLDALAREALDERHDAPDLDVDGARGRVRDAGLAADVDDVRALRHEPPRVRQLRFERREAHGVGERVRTGVDDAHHERATGLRGEAVVAQAQRHRAGT
jgi:hypothetical protein